MNDSKNKRAVLVGLFVTIGLSILIAIVLMVGNIHNTFKRKVKIISLFDNVGGLQTGSNIWFSGVKVGTVNSLSFYGESKVMVNLDIEKKIQEHIRKDAKVKISTDGLIGNKILVIYGGTEKSASVKEGDTLTVEKTFSTEDMMNMLQENNKNLLAITTDFKSISKKVADGEGSIGKLLNETTIYDNIDATTVSLQNASLKANQLLGSLADFSKGLHQKGTLANELVTDTIVYNSVKASVLQLQQMADTATLFIANLKKAGSNPKTSMGVLINDEVAGTQIKQMIVNLESSSKKLDEDLEALQHNFLFRGFFRKKAKKAKDTQLKISSKE